MRFAKQALLGVGLLALVSLSLTGCGRSVAKVNGDKISRKEYLNRLEKMSVNVNGRRQQAGVMALEGLIQEKLRLQLAEKEGVEPTEAQVKERLDMMKNEGSLKQLKDAGYTDEDIRADATLRQANMNILTKGIKVSEAELQAFYKQNKKMRFTKPEGADVGLIVTNTKQKMDLVRNLLKVKKQAFSSVAMKHADIPELRTSKGDLGFLPRNMELLPQGARPPAEVYRALFQPKLRPGEVSEPVKVDKAWYILKCLDYRQEKVESYRTARSRIKEMVMLRKAQEMYDGQGSKRAVNPMVKYAKYVKTSNVKINIRRYAPIWTGMKKQADQAAASVSSGAARPGAR
ncbi:MAG: peptidyl-prolyl cis-trans isomerase [Armatimonadota bacterium]|nr:peptidyl-prolyl cis-trans isomerase [Armatimonadota bacterium]